MVITKIIQMHMRENEADGAATDDDNDDDYSGGGGGGCDDDDDDEDNNDVDDKDKDAGIQKTIIKKDDTD